MSRTRLNYNSEKMQIHQSCESFKEICKPLSPTSFSPHILGSASHNTGTSLQEEDASFESIEDTAMWNLPFAESQLPEYSIEKTWYESIIHPISHVNTNQSSELRTQALNESFDQLLLPLFESLPVAPLSDEFCMTRRMPYDVPHPIASRYSNISSGIKHDTIWIDRALYNLNASYRNLSKDLFNSITRVSKDSLVEVAHQLDIRIRKLSDKLHKLYAEVPQLGLDSVVTRYSPTMQYI